MFIIIFTGPYLNPTDTTFYLELIKDNFTSPITGQDRVVAYWEGGISISVAISEQMLDVVFSADNKYFGNHTKGLLGKGFVLKT